MGTWTRAAVLTGAAVVFASARPVYTQGDAHIPHRQPWWLSTEVQSEMGLTTTQIRRLDAIFHDSLPMRRRLRQELSPLRDQLTRVLDEGWQDDARAQRVIQRVFLVEKQRNVARTVMLIRMYRVLTPEQRARLNTLSAR